MGYVEWSQHEQRRSAQLTFHRPLYLCGLSATIVEGTLRMATTESLTEAATAAPLLFEHVRAATELLECLAADWQLLDQLPADLRERLHRGVMGLVAPDHRTRRRRAKAEARERRAQTRRRQDAVLDDTGIRILRR